MPQLVSGIYSGTAMLNRLLERKGRRVGCIVTAGMEDYLRLERGIQTYLGYSYSDRVHVVTHRHNAPLVPRRWMKGATERVDVFGDVAIPLYRPLVRMQYFGQLNDLEHRFDRTVDVPLLPAAGPDAWGPVADALNGAWDVLDDQVAREFAHNEIERAAIALAASGGSCCSPSNGTSVNCGER
jgi:hypothetical protein